MSINLDDIESRIKDGIDDLDGPFYSGIADDAFSALAEIRAEVERLRVERAEWVRRLVEAKKEGARIAVAERAAVVAWLRDNADAWHMPTWQLADKIESGEHRREET
jgi:hypothetical protein